ncbi:exosome complex component rrp40 [Micractinium conductrix]|uniref:Ribosomal RNA-processing protein 40 n=1 Tax=Micractinium conductrix TaxID=554055 RepID=A0A2P6VJN9_9CHLO|nr:exosome complex component rrp40 [Micractinium conductrix]|eukprot:PSC74316.1 exosome complex component rrp40 [Micractinium conductrix]
MAAVAVKPTEPEVGKCVCPGDAVLALPETGVVRIGGGLQQEGAVLVASKAGVVRQAPRTGKLWVEPRQKRYIPSAEDAVVGRIIDKHSENYGVDIGAPFRALLPVLAFEGATKRNRPNLQVGDLVYARVESAHRDLEPVLSCTDAAGKASGFAHLKGGTVVEVSTTHARALLSRPPAAVLSALGRALQFEMAVGQNGRVWLDAPSPATVILVANAIQSSEFLSPAQQEHLVAALLRGSSAAAAAAARQRQQQQADGQQQEQQQGSGGDGK